jgi:hypothetical protein
MNTHHGSLRASWTRIFICTAARHDWRAAVADDPDHLTDQIVELRSHLTPEEREAEGTRDLCYSLGIHPPHDLVRVELERVLEVVRARGKEAA